MHAHLFYLKTKVMFMLKTWIKIMSLYISILTVCLF